MAFAINAASFAAVLVALAAMDASALRTLELPPRPRSALQVIEQLREGIGYVRHTPPVLLGIVVIGLVSIFGMNFTVVIPALARDVLGTDASGYGFPMTASGVGSLIAAAWIAVSGGLPHGPAGRWRDRPRRGRGPPRGLRPFSVSILLMLVVGFGGITMAATANTMIQLNVPDALRGRAMSVYTTVFAGSTPIGGLLFGWLASAAGVAVAVAIGGSAQPWSDSPPCCGCAARSGRHGSGADCPARRSAARPGESGEVAPAPVEGGVEAMVGPGPALAEPRRDSAVRRAEHDGGIQAAEPERRRQHPAVGPGAPSRSSIGRSAATSGSGSSRFTVGGAQPSRIASAAMAPSIAPDAPSGWP